MASVENLFLEYSVRKLRQFAARIEECLGRLNEEQIWARGTQNENAVGNLVLHLGGNVRQWIASGIGGQPDSRRRDAEFAARGGLPAAELTAHLRDAVDAAVSVLTETPPARLSEHITVQNYDVTVLEAIYHVVEHFSGHTGQIIFATKLITGDDLAFYGHLKAAAAPHAEQTP